MKKLLTLSAILLVFGLNHAFSQYSVSGTVMDLYMNPISDVKVSVKGTDINTMTDKNGNYTINTPEKNAVLVFAKKGKMTDTLKIEGKDRNDIVLVTKPKEKNK